MDMETTAGTHLSRRTLLRWAGTAGMLGITAPFAGCVPAPATSPSTHGVIVADGFTVRMVAAGGLEVGPRRHVYGIFPDGGATFPDPATPGGWYYVANHEVPLGGGGVTSLRFAPDGRIVDAYPICEYTSLNCAGGPTPWGTWLTCEEYDGGAVWECDPTRPRSAVRRPRMGIFAHEAAAVASDHRVYLTEDRPDGGFYRFTPNQPGDLSSGLLEIACRGDSPEAVVWRKVPDVNASTTPCRYQVEGARRFNGGEGAATAGTAVWFTTKGDNRIWRYDLTTETVVVHVDGRGTQLGGADNLWTTRIGGEDGLIVAEDGGDLQLLGVRADGSLFEIVRVADHPGSELAGPALSPDRTRLYFSSQRGPVPNDSGVPLPTPMVGVTFEVRGPFDQLLV